MMNKENIKLIEGILPKERWWDLLSRLIEVLRINIFIVDTRGQSIIAPCRGRYGWRIFEASPIGMDLLNEKSSLLERFKQHGFYLEYQHAFDLHNFAVPIKANEQILGYLIVGPVILNKRLESTHYEAAAKDLNLESRMVLDAMGEIRVISFIGMKAILDLLDEIASSMVDLSGSKGTQSNIQPHEQELPSHRVASDVEGDLFSTLLNTALEVSGAEGGSIMYLEPDSGELVIKASRGLAPEVVLSAHVRVGEGIVGAAAKENTYFVINGVQPPHNRLKKYLKRDDIRQALIMPIAYKDRVVAVLNLHTKSENGMLPATNLASIQAVGRLSSFALSQASF